MAEPLNVLADAYCPACWLALRNVSPTRPPAPDQLAICPCCGQPMRFEARRGGRLFAGFFEPAPLAPMVGLYLAETQMDILERNLARQWRNPN